MPRGDFTKEECDFAQQCVDEIYTELSKPMQMDFLAHLNDVILFIAAAKKAAPHAPSPPDPPKTTRHHAP